MPKSKLEIAVLTDIDLADALFEDPSNGFLYRIELKERFRKVRVFTFKEWLSLLFKKAEAPHVGKKTAWPDVCAFYKRMLEDDELGPMVTMLLGSGWNFKDTVRKGKDDPHMDLEPARVRGFLKKVITLEYRDLTRGKGGQRNTLQMIVDAYGRVRSQMLAHS